jgi:hypothetical protein
LFTTSGLFSYALGAKGHDRVRDSHPVWSQGVFGLWHAAYRRVVRSSYATVPHYRYRWAVDGHGALLLPADAERGMVDLIPLAGGRSEVDPSRGLRWVLGTLAPGTAAVARTLDRLDGGEGVIHDRMLGYLGARGACGHWHLDWPRVYVRETGAGLAVTLLRQDSPRLVDVLAGGGVPGRVAPCPRHRTPVVLP